MNLQLTSLDLRGNFVTVDGIASLVERLASHPGIREIDVSSNSVTEADAHIAGRHLLNLAQQNPQVTVIYCSYLEMSESMLLSIEQALDWNIYHRAVSQTKLDESWKTYMSVLQFCNGKMDLYGLLRYLGSCLQQGRAQDASTACTKTLVLSLVEALKGDHRKRLQFVDVVSLSFDTIPRHVLRKAVKKYESRKAQYAAV
jgi:hypothetical protein